MHSINKLPQAERDIEESFVYIGLDNIDAALAFLAAVDRALKYIARFPFSGVSRTYKNSDANGVRIWLVPDFENYSIFYIVRS